MSLLEAARYRGDRVVASIFVNPMQFGPNEDFAALSAHAAARTSACCGSAAAICMFMPDVARDLSDGGTERARVVEVRGLSRILEGELRPGHFEGVGTVVAKLFGIVAPDVAVFGEKDFQQLTDHPAHGDASCACRWRSSPRRPCATPTAWP